MSYTPRRTLCSSPAGYGVPIRLFVYAFHVPRVDTPGCILSPFQGSSPFSAYPQTSHHTLFLRAFYWRLHGKMPCLLVSYMGIRTRKNGKGHPNKCPLPF